MRLAYLVLVAAVMGCVSARAADSINLGNYAVSNVFALDLNNGASGVVSGLEASAVTYARDRGTLFFVGDEGTGVVEISRTGQTLGAMSFNWAGTGSTNNDSEGLTYLGGGVLVVGEERLQNLYRFTYAANGTAVLGSAPFVSIGPTIGNVGIEGVSYDSRTGGYVTVKQDNPVELRIFGSLAFSTTAGADAVPDISFSGASSLFGLHSFSDIQTLGSVDALAGTPAGDNLLVLSLDSRRLIEINRAGVILSSFDLTNVLEHNGIEGVTVDENGIIYLVAEQVQDGTAMPGERSRLIILAPVPEPTTWGLLLVGVAAIAALAYRRRFIAPTAETEQIFG